LATWKKLHQTIFDPLVVDSRRDGVAALRMWEDELAVPLLLLHDISKGTVVIACADPARLPENAKGAMVASKIH
jgi:hypothetical protein